jgi:signal transduction histidine kinase
MNYVQKTIQNNAKKLCDRTDKQSNVLSEQVGIEAELEMSKVQLEVRNKELEKIVISLETTINKAETATKAKSDFMANISHELRTPMNSILSF